MELSFLKESPTSGLSINLVGVRNNHRFHDICEIGKYEEGTYTTMPKKKEFDKTLKIRLSEDQSDKLEALAEAADLDKSEILRNHIESLPDIRKKDKES